MQTKRLFITITVLFNLLIPFVVQAQQMERPIVRLIYFLPSDRAPQPNIDAEMDGLIKEVQAFFANWMEHHGYGRKTFQFEADANGNAVVHRMEGQSTSGYYEHETFGKVSEEIGDQFNLSEHIYFVVVDSGFLINGYPGFATIGNGISGLAVINRIQGLEGKAYLTSHELRHAFGLNHDFRTDGRGFGQWLSKCTAQFLDVHRHFNPSGQSQNFNPKVKMLPAIFVSPPNSIRFRFEITDAQGIHQVQLHDEAGIIACKQLNGTPNTTVELVPTSLGASSTRVGLSMTDIHGNISWTESFPIDMTALLPPAEVVSIPDPNLAAAVRERIGNSITTHTILNLKFLDVRNRGITDLTGLEHAHTLRHLYLDNTSISDISPLENLTNLTGLYLDNTSISDISPLANLTNLKNLYFFGTSISDISPLENLTNLTELILSNTSISDISPLENLTNLTWLYLSSTSISDISPLTNLTHLKRLDLFGTSISDISPLTNLTNLTWLNLSGTSISDISPLTNLTYLTELYLSSISISDISPLENLTNLKRLDLGSISISDISPLTNLTNLKILNLWGTISDISPLANLTNLKILNLSDSSISDISPLANLTNLTEMNLSRCSISDISPLANLTNLKILNLSDSSISDISPLLELNLTGTKGNSTGLRLKQNPLNYVSLHTHIPAMQARGIQVSFDPRTYPALDIISGAGQQATTGESLANPLVVAAIDPNGTPMPGVPVIFIVTQGNGELSMSNTTVITDANGRAETTFTLGSDPGKHSVRATAASLNSSVPFIAIATTPAARLTADVNGDGVVNIQDLVMVSSQLGQAGQNEADVNRDGVVNIQDMVFVAGELGADAAAPSAWHRTEVGVPSRKKVEQWLTQAHHLSLTDVRSQRGVLLLERLLAALTPKETTVLPSYPNPFNPETWIPYQLSKPAEVTLHIYSVKGALVRTLALGHQPAGMYHSKSRAAYWDGRNEQGERVASGIYFYTLTAGDFTATRRMLIRK